MISAMLQYIQRSPDCFHAVEELRQRLLREGYTELRPGRWQLTAGGKYFTTKNGSSMMAFRLPQEAPAGFLLTASHSDSPCFRLRDHAELTGEYIRLSAERYGGMINDSWLDRPLSVAGRVLVRREGGLEARLVDLKRDVALIPRVAIHLNRETNSGVKYDPARDLVALYAAGTGSGLRPGGRGSRGSGAVQQPAGDRLGAGGRVRVRPPAGRSGLRVRLHRGLSDGAGAGHGAGAVRV